MTEAERSLAADPPPPRGVGRVRKVVTIAFYGVVVALIVLYATRIDFAGLAALRLDWRFLGAALGAGLVQRQLAPVVWLLIVRDLGVTIRNFPAYNAIYAKAWLGRYIPGKVAMVAARVYFADELGASRTVIAISSIAELGSQVLVTGAVGILGIASIAGSIDVIADYQGIAFAMLGVLLLFLWPPVFNRSMRILFRLVGRTVEGDTRIGASTLAWAVSGAIAVSVATGAVAVLQAAAIDPVALEHPLFVWGTYSLAGALGMAFVFAPSGLGAREAVQLPLFSLIMSAEAALAFVLVSRLAELVVDGLFYLVAVVWFRLSRARRARRAEPSG